jgi:uncharacterized protein YggE
MKILLSIILLPVAVGFAQTPAPDQGRVITVHGVGIVTTVPDQVRLAVQVNTREASASAAMQSASKKAGDIIALLGSYGVNKEDVQTSRVTVNPVLDYEKKIQPPPVIGYTGINEFSVVFKGKAMDKVGEFMDRAVSAGASSFGSLQFEASKARALERDALVNAAADARARATVLAKELGATLHKVRQIRESSAAPQPVPMLRTGAMSVMAESPAPVSAGEITVRAEVDVEFDLE